MTTISELIDEYGEQAVTRACESGIDEMITHVTTDDLDEMVRALNSYNNKFPELEWYVNDNEFFDMMFDDHITLIKAVQNADGYNVDDSYVQISQEGYLTSTDVYFKILEEKFDFIIEEYIFENINGNLEDFPNVTAVIEDLLEEGEY